MNPTTLTASPVLGTLSVTEPYCGTGLPYLKSRWLPASGASEFHCAGFALNGVYLIMAGKGPGITDGVLDGAETVVGVSMQDGDDLTINGRESPPAIGLGRTKCEFKIANRTSRHSAFVLFPTDMRDRGWPDTGALLTMAPAPDAAVDGVRRLLADLFTVASLAFERFGSPNAVAGMSDSLHAALDEAFRSSDPLLDGGLSVTQFRLARRIEDYIAGHVSRPIYSEEIAAELGVSLRTLYNVMLRYNGMSLQRYLRLKRLWAVRRELLTCDPWALVKSIALDHGFWHLGRFSREYESQFGELPSRTLERRRAS